MVGGVFFDGNPAGVALHGEFADVGDGAWLGELEGDLVAVVGLDEIVEGDVPFGAADDRPLLELGAEGAVVGEGDAIFE